MCKKLLAYGSNLKMGHGELKVEKGFNQNN